MQKGAQFERRAELEDFFILPSPFFIRLTAAIISSGFTSILTVPGIFITSSESRVQFGGRPLVPNIAERASNPNPRRQMIGGRNTFTG